MKYYTGIDIGSTASKVMVLDQENMVEHFVIPTGWNSKDTAREVQRRLSDIGIPVNEEMKVIARDGKKCLFDNIHKAEPSGACNARPTTHSIKTLTIPHSTLPSGAGQKRYQLHQTRIAPR